MDAIYDHLLELVSAPSQTCQERLEAFQSAMRDPTNRLLSGDIINDLVTAWFLTIAARIPETPPTSEDYAISMLFIACLPGKEPTAHIMAWLYPLWPHTRVHTAVENAPMWRRELPNVLEVMPDECYFWVCENLAIVDVYLEPTLTHCWESKHPHRADPWIERMLADPKLSVEQNYYARRALSYGYWDVYERCKNDNYMGDSYAKMCMHGEALARGKFRIASERHIERFLATNHASHEPAWLCIWLVHVAVAGWYDLFERLIGGFSQEKQVSLCQNMLMWLSEVSQDNDEALVKWIIQTRPLVLSHDGKWKDCLYASIIDNRPAILKLLLVQRPFAEVDEAISSAVYRMTPQIVNILLEHYEIPRAALQKWLYLDADDAIEGVSSGWRMPCIDMVDILWRRDLTVRWDNLSEVSVFDIGLPSPPVHHGMIPDDKRERCHGSEWRRYDLWMPMLRSMEARVCWTLGAILLVTDDYFGVLAGSLWHRYISILNRLPFDLQIVVSRRLFGLNGVGYERASMDEVLKKLLAFLTDAFWSNAYAPEKKMELLQQS